MDPRTQPAKDGTEFTLARVKLGDVLRDSLRLLKGSKSAILLGSAAVLLLSFIATLIASAFFPGIRTGLPNPLESLAAGLSSLLLTSLLLGGLVNMALSRARGGPIQAGMVLSGTRFATRMLQYGLLTMLGTYLLNLWPGLVVQLIGLALSALISFTPHFMVDRDLQLTEAIAASARLVLHNPLQLLGWLMLSVLLIVLSIFTFGVGLIWTLPFIAVSSAMFYLLGTNRR